MIGETPVDVCTLIFDNGDHLIDDAVCGMPAVRVFQVGCRNEHIWWEGVCEEHKHAGESFLDDLPVMLCARCGLEREVPVTAREVIA